MKTTVQIAISSSEEFTGDQLIAAVRQIHSDFALMGWVEKPNIRTHGEHGVHRVVGILEREKSLDV